MPGHCRWHHTPGLAPRPSSALLMPAKVPQSPGGPEQRQREKPSYGESGDRCGRRVHRLVVPQGRRLWR
jgi:hypothetical protein